jgi:hypothetical protein
LISDTTFTRFWLISAHFANLDKMRSLSNALVASEHFVVADSFESKDAFAKLLVRKDPNEKFIYYSIPLPPDQSIDLDKEKVLPLWSGEIALNAAGLSNGKYQIIISSKGTKAAGVYPHVNVFVNDRKIGDYTATPQFEQKFFNFELEENNVVIKLQMDNDLYDPDNNEDRNVFVRSIIINKTK